MTTKKFTARFRKETYKKLEMLARGTHRSKVGMLRYLIQNASKEIKKKRGEEYEDNK